MPHRAGRSWLVLATVIVVVIPLLSAAYAQPSGANLSTPTISTPEELVNPSFEQGTSGWSLTPGAAWAIYAKTAAEDQHYLEYNTGQAGAGASIYQDVSLSPTAGHGYRASVDLRSPTGQPISADLVLWSLDNGGSSPIESGSTPVVVDSEGWQRFSVEVDPSSTAYNHLRVQVFLNSTGVNLDVDAFSLADTGLENASFEQGTAGWNLTPGAAWATYGATAAEDADYLEFNTGQAGSGTSIYQDVSSAPVKGQSFRATMVLRSPSAAPASAQLVLWALGPDVPAESQATTIELSSAAWQAFSVELGVTANGYDDLRVQVYLDTTGVNVDADAAGLTNCGLPNADYEQGFSQWKQGGGGMNVAIYGGSAAEDTQYLETNTGSASSATEWDTFAESMTDKDPYVGYVDLRSPAWRSAVVHLRIFVKGHASSGALTSVTVSSAAWTRYSVELPAGQSGTGLVLKVGVMTRGVNIDIDGAGVQAPIDPVVSGSSCTSTNSCSPKTFSEALLSEPGISAPVTGPNIYALEIWYRAEGGGAGCPGQPPYTSPWSDSGGPAGNPLNTTQSDTGSQATTWNSVGVQQFQNADGQTCWYWGLYATWKTLTNGYYQPILQALRSPASTDYQQCVNVADAEYNDGLAPSWGTGYYVGDC